MEMRSPARYQPQALLAMPRPSLISALARLSELRAQHDRLATERRRIEVRDEPDRAKQLAEGDAERLEVEAEIREALGMVVHLRVRHAASRAARRTASSGPGRPAARRTTAPAG